MAEKRPAKKSAPRNRTRPKKVEPPPEDLASGRQLIVITSSVAQVRASATGVESASGHGAVAALDDALRAAGVSLIPLFGVSEDWISAATADLPSAGGGDRLDYATYYRVHGRNDELHALAATLRSLEAVEAAYVAPGAELAVRPHEDVPLADDTPLRQGVTPNFFSDQGYLHAAPGGIDALYAWTVAGGLGNDVGIVDIEGGWNLSHEDLLQNPGGSMGLHRPDWVNHGTAVLGELGGDSGTFGVTGICPAANTKGISIYDSNLQADEIAKAIFDAANVLHPGDIILIELHMPGPRFDEEERPDQLGYIAIEWWPHLFLAIRYAIDKGVIVVEAAGNGAEDLDHARYDTNPKFMPGFLNPFNPANPSSGAVLVGAGASPPPPVDLNLGGNHGADRSRLEFSNYGARLDAQGWGKEVTTTGYGFLQGGPDKNRWYTDRFSGTSSASPIVAGALASIQGVLRAAGRAPLSPAQAIGLLRATGSPQENQPGRPVSQRIGNRPNLRQAIPHVLTTRLYRYWNPWGGDHFYTTNWGELGFGGSGWGYEWVQCYVSPVQTTQTVPLYRYWNGSRSDHFYTTDWGELGLGSFGWGYEGIQCYVSPVQTTQTVPLFRYWNPSRGDHFYSTDLGELGFGGQGWSFEGVQCHVWTSAAAVGAAFREASPDTSRSFGAPGAGARSAGSVPSFDAEQQTAPDHANTVLAAAPQSFGYAARDEMQVSEHWKAKETASGEDCTISGPFASERGAGRGVTIKVNIGRDE